MSTRSRILAIRIAELVRKNPKTAMELGVSATLSTRKYLCTDSMATPPIVVTSITQQTL